MCTPIRVIITRSNHFPIFRKRRARLKQQRVMAEFAAKRQQFMDANRDELESEADSQATDPDEIRTHFCPHSPLHPTSPALNLTFPTPPAEIM